MPIAPIATMTHDEILEYVDTLEQKVHEQEKKLDNRKKHAPQEVRMMRSLRDREFTIQDIADIFACNPTTVYRILTREYYPEIV